VDVDVVGSNFDASATHSFNSLIRRVAGIVPDPTTGQPLSTRWDGDISTLGSGSDYTSFLDHYGVASMDIQFVQDSYNGVYHSIYDSFRWMSTFGDPQFLYHRAMAQFWGLVGIKLADDVVLPFNFTDDAETLFSFLQTIKEALERNDGVDKVNLSALEKALDDFKNAALKLDVWINKIQKTGNTKGISKVISNAIKASNEILYLTERQFLGPGLKQRPYFKHVLQAPGLYLGYGTQVFPGVQQAILELDWERANIEANILATRIDEAAKFLSGGLRKIHKQKFV